MFGKPSENTKLYELELRAGELTGEICSLGTVYGATAFFCRFLGVLTFVVEAVVLLVVALLLLLLFVLVASFPLLAALVGEGELSIDDMCEVKFPWSSR